MALIQQILIQLIVAAIAFLGGFFLQRLRTMWTYFGARNFWRPLLRRDLILVLGDGFPNLRGFEATDLIGRGDLIASYALTAHFSRMGFRIQPTFADKAVGVDLTGGSLRVNVISLGGPDGNSISQSYLSKMCPSYTIEWPRSAHRSRNATDKNSLTPPRLVYAGEKDETAEPFLQPTIKDGAVVKDYGIVIRARNVFIPRANEPSASRQGKRVVIIYGCYGYGTLAAVLYSQTQQFLKMVDNESDDIECVISCDVVAGTPQGFRCVYFKAHSHGSLECGIDDKG